MEKKIESIVEELKQKEVSRVELDEQLTQARDKMGDIAAIHELRFKWALNNCLCVGLRLFLDRSIC